MIDMFDNSYLGPGKIEHTRSYFEIRDISIDCRGGPVVISSASRWGLRIRTYTQGHDAVKRVPIVNRPLVVHANSWICSDVVLYNCIIGIGSIVAAGSVVSGRDVPEYTMVEGNPARIIARFNGTKWIYLRESEPLPRTVGWKGQYDPTG